VTKTISDQQRKKSRGSSGIETQYSIIMRVVLFEYVMRQSRSLYARANKIIRSFCFA